MTPVFCCGAECGASGQHWTIAGTASFSTSTVRSGARSFRINPTSSVGSFVHTLPSANKFVVRAYVYFATLPSWEVPLISIDIGGVKTGIFFNPFASPGGNNIALGSTSSSGGVSFTVVTGQWYMFEMSLDASSNPWHLIGKVNGTDLIGQDAAIAASTGTDIYLGPPAGITNSTSDFFIDDVVVSQTLADYPIGAGYVNHFVPTSDGTHTATTTTIVKGTIATPVGANVAGATDVFNWVNAVPLLGGATDNTRLVNQQSNGTTLYAEVVFGPAPGISTPSRAPRAVEVITADRQAATTTGDFTTKLNDNGTESSIIARGVVAGSLTDRYATKQYASPPGAGAWTVVSGAGNFNNIRARFGYASDANPDQYWRGIMIEAEFQEIASIPNKIYSFKQSVNRASTY